MSRTIIALFGSLNTAQDAVHDLTAAGFSRDQISLASGAGSGTTEWEAENPAAAGAGVGAAGGALLGGTAGLLASIGVLAIPGIGPVLAAGPLVAILTGAGAGAAVGAVAGGLVGALIDLGVPEADAHRYAEGVRAGGTLLAVTTDDSRVAAATEILRRCGAVEIDQHGRADATAGRQAGRDGDEPLLEDPDRVPGAGAQGMFAAEVAEDDAYRMHFDSALGRGGDTYERFAPAYRYGSQAAARFEGRDWEACEPSVRELWERDNPGSWDRYRGAIRFAWDRRRGR